MAARASSSATFWRVTTTLILNCPKSAAARLSMAWRAAAKEPSPRTGVVGGRGGPVNGDLHVEVVESSQLAGALGAETGAVGGELDPDPALDGVADQVHEVRPQHGLAAADVHVEDLEVDHLVDDVARLGRRQLGRDRAGPTNSGSARRPGCRRRSAPRSSRWVRRDPG